MRAYLDLVSLITFLAIAAASGCASTPDQAAGEPARVDSIDRKLWFEAAEQGNANLLLTMIEEGTDPFIESNGLTALHVSAREGHTEATSVLIDAGIDVDLGPDPTEEEIASVATHGSPQLVELVMGARLDPRAVANAVNLRTPLNLAIENGHVDVAELLIEAGADVNAGGVWYRPLHSAIIYGDVTAVELLLASGANPRAMIRIQDRSSFAGFRYAGPVEIARIIDRWDIVELLLEHGARN